MLPATLPTDRQELIRELEYSLAKRVPDMTRGFSITTTHGQIVIEPEYAEAFRNLAYEVIHINSIFFP